MDKNDIFQALREYIVNEILDGEDVGLDGDTPLLQLGVLNSMEVTRLVGFVEERFGAKVPSESLTPQNLENLQKITELVASHAGS